MNIHRVVRLAVVCFMAMTAFVWSTSQAQEQGVNQQQSPTAQRPNVAQGRGHGLYANLEYPVLPIGSPLPAFNLPGIDGKMHSSDEYKNARILAIVFESNHCPVSIAYEERIRAIYDDYKGRGLELVAINPNNPKTVAVTELGYTDETDSMPDMKIRAQLRHIDWPYLYDGETQETTIKFGAVATPHIFIFDQDRKLRYEGRIDDATDIRKVKSNDARNAIDAVLAGQPVPIASTQTFGCSTKWLSKASGVAKEMDKINSEPVTLTPASLDDFKMLRANNTDKTLVIEFYSLKCKDCLDMFADYETTYHMYRLRKFDMVTVATDTPNEEAQILDYLKQQHASGKNLIFNSADSKGLQAAFAEKWKVGAPYVMVIAPGGTIVYQKAGKVNILDVRRYVLATIPNDGPWFGVQEYWTSVIKAESAGQ